LSRTANFPTSNLKHFNVLHTPSVCRWGLQVKLRQEIMEIFEVVKDKLGFDSKRYSTLLLVCAIALPVSFMILIMYQNPSFDLSGGLAKAEKSGNVPIINAGKTSTP
jgi:hypothetical protein